MSNFWKNSFTGSLVADAVAMPVHWYYDTAALDRDVPDLSTYQPPPRSHPDSILWRSQYTPPTPDADILHEQARFWGRKHIHYHQFLQEGENTLNFQLARELHQWILSRGHYDPEGWLTHYVQCLRTPGWHRDTYVEEVHRGFFIHRAQGRPLTRCAISDNHIGGLAQVPALLASLAETGTGAPEELRNAVVRHVSLTHQHAGVQEAATTLFWLLHALSEGQSLATALETYGSSWISLKQFQKLETRTDREVIGQVFSPACYIDDAFPAALFLAWKYREDFELGIIANARCGGDNCHRGAVPCSEPVTESPKPG